MLYIVIEVFPNHTTEYEVDIVPRRAQLKFYIGGEAQFYVIRPKITRMTAERKLAAEYACMLAAQSRHLPVSQMKLAPSNSKKQSPRLKPDDPRNFTEKLF